MVENITVQLLLLERHRIPLNSAECAHNSMTQMMMDDTDRDHVVTSAECRINGQNTTVWHREFTTTHTQTHAKKKSYINFLKTHDNNNKKFFTIETTQKLPKSAVVTPNLQNCTHCSRTYSMAYMMITKWSPVNMELVTEYRNFIFNSISNLALIPLQSGFKHFNHQVLNTQTSRNITQVPITRELEKPMIALYFLCTCIWLNW